MTLYIDDDFKCYVKPSDGLIAVKTSFFDGKCAAYIEGYRFVPVGSIWMAEDGTMFAGEMIVPWKEWAELDIIQREYEREQVSDLTTQNAELLSTIGEMVEEVYQSDLDVMEGDTDV